MTLPCSAVFNAHYNVVSLTALEQKPAFAPVLGRRRHSPFLDSVFARGCNVTCVNCRWDIKIAAQAPPGKKSSKSQLKRTASKFQGRQEEPEKVSKCLKSTVAHASRHARSCTTGNQGFTNKTAFERLLLHTHCHQVTSASGFCAPSC